MKAARLLITGRVQGVGFRDWLVAEARNLRLRGWVRNVGDDAVEAVIEGNRQAVDLCAQVCSRGPPLAKVDKVTERAVDPPGESSFSELASIRRLS